MSEEILIGFGAIIILGILSQWLAWRLHLPAILLLLVGGIIAGPITGILHPDEIFGELLFPVVSISVAVILFEGGLSLRFREIRQLGKVVLNLTTICILVTWVLSALLAWALLGLPLNLSILLGAVLVVSGPTVIIPLLRQVRPKGRVSSIIKWEGIINDPIGAILAVLVFEAIAAQGGSAATAAVIEGVVAALVLGTLTGLVCAAAIVLLIRRYLIPDFLQNGVALMMVVVCYILSNHFQPESGLLAVTVMGIALANQRFVSIRHILEFKENLRVLLISSLFVILAARVDMTPEKMLDPSDWIFVALLILLVRPVAVGLSTIGTQLSMKERAFVGWMAPRGIVAAAVTAVFALRLEDLGYQNADTIVSITFLVIIGTVTVYGLTASPVARWLKLAQPNPQGVLFGGAPEWARDMAAMLHKEGIQVALVDTNWSAITRSRKIGLRAYYANLMSEELMYELDLEGIGRLAAMTPNDEVNALAALHFVDTFGRKEVYQLVPTVKSGSKGKPMPQHLRGRLMFSEKATFDYVQQRYREGATLKKTSLTGEYTFEKFKEMYGESALPLFVITEEKELAFFTTESRPTLRPGMKLISLVDPLPEDESTSEARRRSSQRAEEEDKRSQKNAAATTEKEKSETPPSESEDGKK